MKSMKQGWLAAIPMAWVGAAALTRLVPHPPNVAPMGAMALFCGWHYGRKNWLAALGVPLAALMVSDLILNNFVYHLGGEGGWTWFYVGAGWTYAAMALEVVWGWLALRRFSATRLAGASVGASLVFFAVSNFGVWHTARLFEPPMYPHTLAGLEECYVAGLPFLANGLLGDLVYSAVLFAAYLLAVRPQLAKAGAEA